VIRFFTIKKMKASAIHIDFDSVYGPEALALSIVNKWQRHFRQGRVDLFDSPNTERPLTSGVAGAIVFMLKEWSFSSFKVFHCHSRMERRRATGSVTTSLA
jgi:hypothetical protein